MSVLLWPLWILLGLLCLILALALLIVLLCAVPVRYTARADNTDFSLRASWLFSLVRYVYERRADTEKSELRVLFFKVGAKKKPPQKPKPQEPKKVAKKKLSREESASQKGKTSTKKPVKSRNPLTYRRLKPIIKPTVAAVKKILRQLRPTYISVSGTFGLSCPYQTGLIFGAYETLAGILNVRDKIQIAGDFNTDVTVFNIQAEVRGKVSPLKTALPVIGLILKKPVRELLWGSDD